MSHGQMTYCILIPPNLFDIFKGTSILLEGGGGLLFFLSVNLIGKHFLSLTWAEKILKALYAL